MSKSVTVPADDGRQDEGYGVRDGYYEGSLAEGAGVLFHKEVRADYYAGEIDGILKA